MLDANKGPVLPAYGTPCQGETAPTGAHGGVSCPRREACLRYVGRAQRRVSSGLPPQYVNALCWDWILHSRGEAFPFQWNLPPLPVEVAP